MIYLDNAATSWPKPEAVYQAMDNFMRHTGANPGRSAHQLSIEAGRIIYETRESLSMLFGIGDPMRIVFTSNATEALNVVIRGLLHPGDHVITSSMEHNSVMRPLRHMEKLGVEVTVVKCSSEGFLNPHDVEQAVGPHTRLVILNHASNVVGTLLPVAEVGQITRRRGVLLMIDAAQTMGCYPVDVEEMHIDLLAFSGHKGLYGPQGTGGLYIRKGIESSIEPLKYGGTGSRSEHEYQPDFLPDKYESGTPNTVGLAGLGAGVRFVLEQGVNEIQKREQVLTRSIIDGLKAIPGVTIYGDSDPRKRVAVVSFNISGLIPSEVAMQLEEYHQIMCRPGLHCSPIAHKTLGTFPQGTIRLSPGYFTSDDDIEGTLEAVRRIIATKARF
ncbi:MAG: cysteine desulfurase [Chloroflexi bacterium RBG_13_53_26]|jgi:cysteine desulfurase family protein|nr:MAG: cysteine desulfurase [Chloroflexi bacterium RBG_13_53_26]